VDDQTFKSYWEDISNALLGLGAGASYGAAINQLKAEDMDPDMEEHYKELLKEWKKDDDSTKDKVEEMEGMIMIKKRKEEEDSSKEEPGEMEKEGDLAQKLKDKLINDERLKELFANPLNTALLCLICEEFQGKFPDSITQLYVEIVQCVLRRYRKKKGLPVNNEDLIEVYKTQLKHLGSIALHGLREDNMYFTDKQLGNHMSDLPGFGFLSVQRGSSKLRPCTYYGFMHKSFQEFFAAYFLCCQLLSGEISPEGLAADDRDFRKLKQVLLFTCGMLATQSEETAEALIKSIATQVNEGDFAAFALGCIGECQKEQSDFHVELARTFGSFLRLTELDLSHYNLNAATLAEALKTNTTLTELDLSNNNLNAAGAAALVEALNTNTTLTVLHLSNNNLNAAGAAALAEALNTNTTLTVLHLSNNNLNAAGAAALAEALKMNTTLTVLGLPRNNLNDAGAAALAEALKMNTTLTLLDLSVNNLNDAGVAALAEALKTNTTLTLLGLSINNLNDAGAAALAEALNVNTTLSQLLLFNCGFSRTIPNELREEHGSRIVLNSKLKPPSPISSPS